MSKRILIVEDSISQAVYLKQYFEMHGYEAMVVHTGYEVMDAAEEYNPKLIILDYQLPDITGIEVCKNLKHDLYLRIIPVIMYSADSRLRNMVKAYEIGADYYVVKDEESDRVLQVLIETIFNRRARHFNATSPSVSSYQFPQILSA